MSLLNRLLGKSARNSLSSRLIDEAASARSRWDLKFKDLPSSSEFLELSPEGQCAVVVETAAEAKRLISGRTPYNAGSRFRAASNVLRFCLNRNLPFEEKDILLLLKLQAKTGNFWGAPIAGAVKALENFTKEDKPGKELIQLASKLSAQLRESSDVDERKFGLRIDAALGGKAEVGLKRGDVWADQAISELSDLPEEELDRWSRLLELCESASGSKPTKKWLKEAETIVPGEISEDVFADRLLGWLPLVDKPAAEGRVTLYYGHKQTMPPMQLEDRNQDILKGLVWIAGRIENADLIRAVSGVGISAFKKLPGVGPRATRLGNACVYALGMSESKESLAQLSLLKLKIKNRGTQNQIAKVLAAAAERAGVTPDELEEISVPGYGFTEVGACEVPFGEFTARLEVAGGSSTQLLWIKPDGKTQKSVPAKVREEFPEQLKEIRATAKDVQKLLPAIRERIDGCYLKQKRWKFSVWRERYLDHPMVGSISRRLIWRLEKEGEQFVGMYREGVMMHHSGEKLDLEDDCEEYEVSLWHPLDGETDDALDWRSWIEEQLIQQPFKQAHREVYILTEAEENTETYSNRYAAHIIRQHQFNALCLSRYWKNTLRLMVDDCYPPASRYLEEWGIRAEYWIEGIGDDYGGDTTDTGTYLYLVTDQVRFYPIDSAQMTAHAGGGGYGTSWRGGDDQPMDLENVPKLVFSEIMRDCDLFVGVASVGNDPNWSDGGPGGQYRDYWQSYSFGELSATAETRKQILERLLPKLKIAAKARIEGKFLVVEGTVRTYKIHLGSGNILMSPSDQYLCIVPNASARRGADKVFLPFEGDGVMAIILSKAFLLAEDDKITDRTILSQIGRR